MSINAGIVQTHDYLDREQQNKLNEWIFPIILSGEGIVPEHEDFYLTVELQDGYAIFDIYADITLVASNCVTWTKGGSDDAWKNFHSVYRRFKKFLRDSGIIDMVGTPTKPRTNEWIATLSGKGPVPWEDVLYTHGEWFGSLILGVGLAILDFNRQGMKSYSNQC